MAIHSLDAVVDRIGEYNFAAFWSVKIRSGNGTVLKQKQVIHYSTQEALYWSCNSRIPVPKFYLNSVAGRK